MSKMPKIARFGGKRDETNALGMIVHPVVFYASAAIIMAIVFLTVLNTKQVESLFSTIQAGMSDRFGWLYILAMNIFLGYVVFLGFSRYGKIRLGGPDAKPDFGVWGWFAMLFSAGMGIGLLFFGVGKHWTFTALIHGFIAAVVPAGPFLFEGMLVGGEYDLQTV